jgi:hypothetical protein
MLLPKSLRTFWYSPFPLFYSESRSGTSPASNRRLEPLRSPLLEAPGRNRHHR